jgi:hypothetical protein
LSREHRNAVCECDPIFALERELWGGGVMAAAGVDEVGVGALAGPLIAAAVILAPVRLSRAWPTPRCSLRSAAKRSSWWSGIAPSRSAWVVRRWRSRKPGVLAAEIESCRTGEPELLGVIVDVQRGGAEDQVVEAYPKDLGSRPLDSIDDGLGTMVNRRWACITTRAVLFRRIGCRRTRIANLRSSRMDVSMG